MPDDPLRELIQSLPDEIAAAREAGLPVVLERRTPLPVHAQRLMDTLGVEVRLMSIADAVDSRDCAHNRCDRQAGSHSDYCSLHTENGGSKVRTSTRRVEPWTKAEALQGVHAFARQHGRPPSSTERAADVPSQPTAAKLFGSWSAMIEAAGFEKPTSATRYRTDESADGGRLDEREPEAYGAGMRPSRRPTVRSSRASRSSSRPEIVSLTATQLIVAGRLMEAIADTLVVITKAERRVVWAVVEPLVSEVLDA